MALNLGTLNITFTSDTRDLDRGIKRARQKIADLDGKTKVASESLDTAADKTTKLGREADKTSSSLTRMAKNFAKLSNKLRVFAFFIGGAIGLVVSLTKELAQLSATAAGVFVNVMFETARERLQSVSDTTELAESRLDALVKTASAAGANFLAVGGAMGTTVAALQAAGFGFETARKTASGFIDSMTNLGIGASDVSSKLEDLAEIARTGEVTMADLREAVEFTNDPVGTLAGAFGLAREEIEALIESEQRLSLRRLPQLASELKASAGASNSLTEIFNRLVNETAKLFEVFNKAGVIESVKSVMVDLAQFLDSDAATRGIREFARGTNILIRETLPNLALSTVKNWDTIVRTIKAAAGFLIGAALGGIPGGVIGALVGGFEKTAKVMAVLQDIAVGLASVFETELAGKIGNVLNTMISKLKEFAALAGRELAEFEIQSKLTQEMEKLGRLLQEREDLIAGGLTDRERKADLPLLDQQIAKQEQVVKNLRNIIKLTNEGERKTGKQLVDRIEGGEASDGVKETASAYEQLQAKLAKLHEENEKTNSSFDDTVDMLDLLKKRAQEARDAGGVFQRLLAGDDRTDVEKTVDLIERLRTAGEQAGDAIGASFTTAVIEGEKLRSVLQGLLTDISRIILQQTVSEPLGRITGNLITQGLGSMFGGGGGTQSPIGGPVPRVHMAEGGVTRGPALAGEAGPEAVVPLPDGRSIPVSGAGGFTLVINDQRSSDAPDIEQSESVGPDGRRQIELTVRDVVTDQINKGEFDKPLRNRFGQRVRTRSR